MDGIIHHILALYAVRRSWFPECVQVRLKTPVSANRLIYVIADLIALSIEIRPHVFNAMRRLSTQAQRKQDLSAPATTSLFTAPFLRYIDLHSIAWRTIGMSPAITITSDFEAAQLSDALKKLITIVIALGTSGTYPHFRNAKKTDWTAVISKQRILDKESPTLVSLLRR